MRYLIAMAVAIVAALLVTLFVSPQLADLVVDRFTFESPDEVADLLDVLNVCCDGAECCLIEQASGGGVFWIGNGTVPEIRRVSAGRAASGHNWMGLRQNGDYVVTGFSELPLLPAFAALLLAVGLLIAAWRREGR